MELRSGRSRSNTPFSPNIMDNDVILTGNHVEKVSKTKTTTVKTFENVSSESKRMKLKSKKSQRGLYRTSDYSSEEGEHEISSSGQHISDNLKNQLREERFYATKTQDDVSALKIYKDAGEYWNKFPKTDYTYSKHSKDRIELAPGVIAMPNMSRRSLHSYSAVQGGYTMNKQTNTDSYMETDSLEYSSTATNGSSLKHRSFHSNNNQDEEVEEEEFIIRRRFYSERTVLQRFVQVFISIFTTVFYPLYYVYNKQYSLILWLAKILHNTASRLMLFDTWLLRGSSSDRKISMIMGLCLFPLLLFGGWWLICGLGHLFRNAFFNSTILPIEIPQIRPTESPWWIETAINTDDKKRDDVVIGDNGMRELGELRAQIEMIQSEFVKSENTRRDSLSNADSIIADLRMQIDAIQSDLAGLERERKHDLAKLLADLESKRSADKEEIMVEIGEQRRKSLIDVEHYVFKFLKEIFGTPNHVINKQDFTKWIKLIFIAQQELESRLTNLTVNLRKEFITIVADNEKLLMDKVASKILQMNVELGKSKNGDISSINFSNEHIKKMVVEALAIYDADKTGLVDFALESAGGHVISTRCTEIYQVKIAILSIFGIPIYYPTNSARTAITPGTNPGECWAFQNFPGFLVIKLSARIMVEAFTVEHISKRLSATGKIDSALKQFEVYGLVNETDPDPVLLGSYEYRDDGKPLQYFEVQNRGHIFDMIELKILSNHGNSNYTCLYRFRVHGTLSQEPT